MKRFEVSESMTSLYIAAYSIEISGYVVGYDHLSSMTLGIRCFSVATSLLTLPLAALKLSQVGRMKMATSKELKDLQRATALQESGTSSSLLGLHVAEFAWPFTLLVLQLTFRPYGIFVFMAAYLLVMVTALLIVNERRVDSLSVACKILAASLMGAPLIMIFHVSTDVSPKMDRAICYCRCIAIVAAWSAVSLGYFLSTPELTAHLMTPNCIGLTSIGAMGSMLYVVCLAIQQYKGRFNEEPDSKNRSFALVVDLEQE